MGAVIETTNFTLTVYSGKEALERLDNPAPAGKDEEIAVELKKHGLSPTGAVETSALGIFIDCKDADGNRARVLVARKQETR